MSSRHISAAVDPGPLGQSLSFAFSRRMTTNRFLKAAMSERLCTWSYNNSAARGIPTDSLVNLYLKWGEGGVGMLISGNMMIDSEHLEAAGNPVVAAEASLSGTRFEAFQRLANAGKCHGSLFVAQVNHPGRQVDMRIQHTPVSASDIQLNGRFMGMRFAKPHAASKAEILDIIRRFADTAKYLEKAGFDGVQIHGAHGYLIAQFLSMATNKRLDEYGGCLQNRARLILQIAAAIRKVTRPDFILGIKINSIEFQADGFSTSEASELVRLLETSKFDFIELSGGTYEQTAFSHKRESTRKREAFFLDMAEKIAPNLQASRLYVTGGFKTVGAMADALKTVHGIGLGRPLAQEPYLAKQILNGHVKGIIRQLFDQDDVGLTNLVAGSQMLQISQGCEPLDGSDATCQQAFMTALREWFQKQRKDADFTQYGYVSLDSSSPCKTSFL